MSTSDEPSAPPTKGRTSVPNLSHNYPHQTGNTTLNLFSQITHLLAPISNDSVIHDNACGPGTASSVILKQNPSMRPTIVGTDMAPLMIEAFDSTIQGPNISGKVMNSQDLDFPDDYFTHSITNFSIFKFQDPLACVKEIQRTLRPTGQAIITTWKSFAIGDIVNETQRQIRPDLPLWKYAADELYSTDLISSLMTEAGFIETKIQILPVSVLVTGEDLEGLQELATGPTTNPARNEWSSEEKDRWGDILGSVLEEAKKKSGGLVFEGWALLGVK